jgi:hypothetical protein
MLYTFNGLRKMIFERGLNSFALREILDVIQILNKIFSVILYMHFSTMPSK